MTPAYEGANFTVTYSRSKAALTDVDAIAVTAGPGLAGALLVGVAAAKGYAVAADKPIEWKATKEKAEARLENGKAAEVVLKKNPGISYEPIVIKNMKYWGTPRNDGFVLMQNEVEALRQVPEGQKPFEFKGTNGFMITFDIKSDDVGADAKKKM